MNQKSSKTVIGSILKDIKVGWNAAQYPANGTHFLGLGKRIHTQGSYALVEYELPLEGPTPQEVVSQAKEELSSYENTMFLFHTQDQQHSQLALYDPHNVTGKDSLEALCSKQEGSQDTRFYLANSSNIQLPEQVKKNVVNYIEKLS